MAAPKKRKATRREWGKLRTLPSGRLQASYVGPDGERHNAPMTFDNKGDAQEWLRGIGGEVANGAWASPSSVAAAKVARSQTLAEYAEGWLALKTRRPRTVAEYRRLIAGPLADLAALPLADITPDVVKRWYVAERAGGKLTQASRAYSLLSTVLGEVVSDGRLPSNPCRVKGAQSERTGKKVAPPTGEQLAAIVAAIPERFRALVYLAAEAGLRWGEATDLRRDDVTVERGDEGEVVRVLVSVSHAVTRTSAGFASGPTKTAAGIRAVYVYGAPAVAIADHLKAYVPRFGNPLLFPAADGVRHLSQSTFHTPTWNDARTAAGRPDMPFHALRHYAGTRYAQHGATLQETMTRLGHSSVAVAMRYQHATDRDAEIAARMAKR
jgi:integrase